MHKKKVKIVRNQAQADEKPEKQKERKPFSLQMLFERISSGKKTKEKKDVLSSKEQAAGKPIKGPAETDTARSLKMKEKKEKKALSRSNRNSRRKAYLAKKKEQLTDAAKQSQKAIKRNRLSGTLDLWCRRFAQWISSGFLGKILTAYSKEEAVLLAPFSRFRRTSAGIRSADRKVASAADFVFRTESLKRLRYAMLTCPSGYYVDAILLYSIFAIVSNYIALLMQSFLALTDASKWLDCAIGVLSAFARRPIFWVNAVLFFLFFFFGLAFRRYSLHQIKQKSLILSGIFSGLLGMKGDLTENLKRRFLSEGDGLPTEENLRTVLLFIGGACGVFSVFMSPLTFLVALILILVMAIIIRNPESGLILSLMAMPFATLLGDYNSIYLVTTIEPTFTGVLRAIGYPVIVLSALVGFTVFSFLLKAMRKKRRISFGLIDLAVAMFAVGILVYIIFPYPTLSSVTEGILALVLCGVYFLASNFLKTEVWLKRALVALQVSVTVTLSAGIYIYFFGVPELGWFSLEYVSGEVGVMESFFGGSSSLGAYLVMMFPLSVSAVLIGDSILLKGIGLISSAEILVVSFLLPEATALVCIVIAMLGATLLMSYKMLYVTPIILITGVSAYQFIPSSVLSGMTFTGVMTETLGKGIYLWDSFFATMQNLDLSLWGIGYGLLRYREYFGPEEPFVGSTFAIRYFLAMGLPGLILAAVLLVFLVQMSFEEMRAATQRFSHWGIVGALSAVTSVLFYGIFTPIFTSPRIFFLFWVCVGITVAFCRASKTVREEEARSHYEVPSERNATVTIS